MSNLFERAKLVRSLKLPLLQLMLGWAVSAAPISAELSRSVTQPSYAWSTASVGDTAELLTLKCGGCGPDAAGSVDVPLIAVLRDTLGDRTPGNDRVLYVWLLPSSSNRLTDHLLSAVPFFYWRVGGGESHPSAAPSPLLNLNAPLHPVLSAASRKLLQWAAFDPLDLSIRAASRSYQANAGDNERIQLEQTITYLQSAPTGSSPGLTDEERNTAIARLTLRKTLLGGLINSSFTARYGQQAQLEGDRVRMRNAEMLRQLAEKTGTYFEKLPLAGNSDEFAILWFPLGAKQPATGTDVSPLYKLLNIRDPWADAQFSHWSGASFERAVGQNGALLPSGGSGARSVQLVPLAVYSLNYSRMPLLLADFRDKHQVRRHEMLQRSITEVTGGIIGISHFGNWYYYAAAMLYDTVWARRGTASHQAERLDCYARFRARLALDRQMEPGLYSALAARAEFLITNPLSPGLAESLRSAQAHSDYLQEAAQDGTLVARLNDERRAELARFAASPARQATDSALHTLSFGTFTRRVSPKRLDMASLHRDRRVNRQLEFLENATRGGTDLEVAYDTSHIARAIHELSDLLPLLESQPVRERAIADISRVRSLVSNPILQGECSDLILAVNTHGTAVSVVSSR